MSQLKPFIYLFTVLCVSLLTFTGCSDDEKESEGNSGILQLSVGFNSKTITVETKADADTDSCKVLIKNSDGNIIQKFEKVADIPSELWLIAGKYTIEASTGTPKTAEFDKPYYSGLADITIQANKANKHEITCRLSQSKVSVVYGKNLNSYYTDYTTVISLDATKLEFKKDSTKIGYFYAPDGDKDLLCKVTGKNNQSEDITSEYIIKNIKPYTHYIINVDINNSDDGGLKFTIEAEENPDVKEDDINVSIKKYPEIKGLQDNIETTDFVFFEDPTNGSYSLKASSALGIKEFIINNSFLNDIISRENVNFMRLSFDELNDLKIKGFEFEPNSDPVNGMKEFTVKIPVKTTNAKAKESFTVSVTDTHNQMRTKSYTMLISDMKASTDWRTNDVDAWATHAFLHGKWFPSSVPSGISMEYKKTSDPSWTPIPNNMIDFTEKATTKQFFARIDYPASESAVTYEYRVLEGGKTSYSQTFTTEAALPLPNGSFDNWYHNGQFYTPNSTANAFWGTGNNSFTRELTTPIETPVVTAGGKAARLKSQSAPLVGFAAGNLFTGDFEVKGSGGEIAMGRIFNSRPTKLTGYYQYATDTINVGGIITFPSGKQVNVVVGSPATCAIYIVMTSEPFKVSTNTPSSLFDLETQRFKDITFAYAELPIEKCVNTNGAYKDFELNLQYLKDEKPENLYITIVCSADRYGDYFKGSYASELFLDDFKLIYE